MAKTDKLGRRRTARPMAAPAPEHRGGTSTRSGPAEKRAGEVREAFAHLHAADPVLAALIDKRPQYDPDAWLLDLPRMDLFGCLVFQVIGQQISVAAAKAILGRLTDRFDGRLPKPEQVAALSPQDLRTIGMSWRKAGTVLDLADRFADGRLSERRLRTLPDDQIIAELTRIKGIGPWTVHGALLIALQRSNVVPTGDLVLRQAMRRSYRLDHLPTPAEVLNITAVWTPYASLGVNLLFASAELD